MEQNKDNELQMVIQARKTLKPGRTNLKTFIKVKKKEP